MATARDIVSSSLRLIGALASGETAQSPDANDALSVMNQMLETWNLERLMLYTTSREVFQLVASQQSYTMGPSGNFNTNRPSRIERASTLVTTTTPNIELPIDIVTEAQWQDIRVKTITSTFPTKMWNQGGNPLLTLWFWPTPTVVNSVVLYSWPGTQLAQITDLNTTIALPPGYLRALRYNLAMELYPEYGRAPDPVVLEIAKTSKGDIKRVNAPLMDLRCDAALRVTKKGFNRLTGY